MSRQKRFLVRQHVLIRLLGAAILAAMFAGVSGCGHEQVTAASNDGPAVKVESAPDLNVLTVTKPERFVVTAAIARRESDQLSANGVVAADVSRTVPVNALSSGRVVEVRARLGDEVKPGQVLLVMTSQDMSQAISDYQKFQSSETLTKAQLDRDEFLYSNGVYAKKDLEVARDTYNKAKVDTKASAEHIRILGGDPEHPSSMTELHAPVAGTIIEQNVTPSAGIKSLDNSPNLFTIADLSHVWVLVDVYENDLAKVHEGDRADIELNAYPKRRFQGRVTNISKLLDPNTRAAKVRIELPNEGGLLRPNMFATVHFISQGTEVRTVVPATSVLRLHDRDWLFVKLNDGRFRRTEVQAGQANPDGTQEILSGVRAGDQVVSDALTFDREVENEK
jgi:cobalt-zinc-cadmium efflux system membrane fusion protein